MAIFPQWSLRRTFITVLRGMQLTSQRQHSTNRVPDQPGKVQGECEMIRELFRRSMVSFSFSLSVFLGSVGGPAEAQHPTPLISLLPLRQPLVVTPLEESGTVPQLGTAEMLNGTVSMLNESDHEGSRVRRYAVRGAIVGLVGGVALVVFLPCDQNCQSGDSGRAGRLVGLPVAVALGATIGAGVGAIVDKIHGR